MQIRRIVTGRAPDGSSIIVGDGPAPRTHDFASVPGFSNTVLWATDGAPTASPDDPTPDLRSFVPAPGGTRLIIAHFPPDSVFASSGFDAGAAAGEQLAELPGLAETFEPDAPGFHTTPTVDYVIVVEGELWLELDNGEETLVRQGDVVIQNATRHAWRNRGDRPALLAGVLVGVAT